MTLSAHALAEPARGHAPRAEHASPALVRLPRPAARRHGAAAGLRSDEGMAAVEALMHSLAGEGLAGGMVREHLATGGKRLRARLALAALAALGAERRAGLAWAAACELLHNATLVHDDLQDGDLTRRGHPTVWARHGAAQAINAGDLLLMLPFLALERAPGCGETRFALSSSLAAHAAEVVRGQAAEIALASSECPGWGAYLAAARGKTGALFELAVQGAALLAGRGAERARALAAPFRTVGVLFQLQDDVLDLYGDKGRGAPGADLREGKASALVVEHLALHPGDGPWLRALLALPRERTPQAEVERATHRFRTGGALPGVVARIGALAREVAADPALAAEPALHELACELAAVAVDPIRHVEAELGDCRPVIVVDGEVAL